jgi:hypothetical protein
LGAKRLIILPTGHAWANQAPPVGAVANTLHALALSIARQLVSELENLDPSIEYFVVPTTMPAGGITLRLLAHIRSHLTCDSDYRCGAGAERAGAERAAAGQLRWFRFEGLRCSAKRRHIGSICRHLKNLLGLAAIGVTSVNLEAYYVVYRLFRKLD